MTGIAVNYDKVLSLVGDVIRIALPLLDEIKALDESAPITGRTE